MNRIKEFFHRFQLCILVTFIVFVIMVLVLILSVFILLFLIKFNVLKITQIDRMPLLFFCLCSLILGIIFTFALTHSPLEPIQQITEAMSQVSKGDYTLQVQEKGPKPIKNLCHQFNLMTKELNSVEMLRNDFVNNFSHEFKTPIVSIRGFAKALKWDDCSKEEKDEYLNIIIEESQRLSSLSESVLNLSKIEQQSILINTKQYNLSEQIRLCIALLESKWSQKNINFDLELDEKIIIANEELLKEVWINLIDNAIKFTQDNGQISISIKEKSNHYSVLIKDNGIGMSKEVMNHVFEKFYQGDSSHSKTGNGLGLTLVEKIVKLHHGTIYLSSIENKGTEFTVELPKNAET